MVPSSTQGLERRPERVARDGMGESLPPTPRDASRGIRVPIAVLRHLVDTDIPTDTRYHEFFGRRARDCTEAVYLVGPRRTD